MNKKGKMRKQWRLEPKISCGWSKEQIVFIPTIVYSPWYYRYTGSSAFNVFFLGFYICFGEWKFVEEGDNAAY